MKSVASVLLITLAAASAVAHPTDTTYQTRGECEAAYAESSKDDRNRLAQLGVFDSKGAAQRTFNDIFECRYDPEDDVWYIVFLPAE